MFRAEFARAIAGYHFQLRYNHFLLISEAWLQTCVIVFSYENSDKNTLITLRNDEITAEMRTLVVCTNPSKKTRSAYRAPEHGVYSVINAPSSNWFTISSLHCQGPSTYDVSKRYQIVFTPSPNNGA